MESTRNDRRDSRQPNRFAVVTGASTGIGFEFAKILAKQGYDLLVVADEDRIFESGAELSESGTLVEPLFLDLAKRSGVEKLFACIQSSGRAVDILALNAGVGVNGDFARENPLADEINLLNLNIVSVVHLAKLVLPQMIAQGSGRVLITSSIAALMPGPFYATYAASKAFLLSFSEAIFNELRDTGVTVTALMPGATDTEFFARAGMEDTPVGQADKDDPALVAQQAFEALMKGADHIIAGSMKNRVQGLVANFLSEQTLANLQRQQTVPRAH